MNTLRVALVLLASATAADAQGINGHATPSPLPTPPPESARVRDGHGYITCSITKYCLKPNGEWTPPPPIGK